jgi:hypothetical protein
MLFTAMIFVHSLTRGPTKFAQTATWGNYSEIPFLVLFGPSRQMCRLYFEIGHDSTLYTDSQSFWYNS